MRGGLMGVSQLLLLDAIACWKFFKIKGFQISLVPHSSSHNLLLIYSDFVSETSLLIRRNLSLRLFRFL
jgi:hypothetical protein